MDYPSCQVVRLDPSHVMGYQESPSPPYSRGACQPPVACKAVPNELVNVHTIQEDSRTHLIKGDEQRKMVILQLAKPLRKIVSPMSVIVNVNETSVFIP